MQHQYIAGAGRDAIASVFQNRRNFLFSTAGLVALMSAAANMTASTIADDRSSPQEQALMKAINQHSHIVAERDRLPLIYDQMYAAQLKDGAELAGIEPSLNAEDDRLYDEQHRLESEIANLPCTSQRMAAVKARFAYEHLLPDEHHLPVEFGGAAYLPAMLRSIAGLGTATPSQEVVVWHSPERYTQKTDEDPLLATIDAYRGAVDTFDGDRDDESEDAHMEMILRRQEVLEGWEAPASTLPAAIAALKLALDEIQESFVAGPSVAMLKAALGYLQVQESAA